MKSSNSRRRKTLSSMELADFLTEAERERVVDRVLGQKDEMEREGQAISDENALPSNTLQTVVERSSVTGKIGKEVITSLLPVVNQSHIESTQPHIAPESNINTILTAEQEIRQFCKVCHLLSRSNVEYYSIIVHAH